MSVLGIDNYRTSAVTGSVLIHYDSKQLRKDQLVEILDAASSRPRHRRGKTRQTPFAALHRVAAAGGGCAVPGAAAIADRRGAFPVHLDPDISEAPRGTLRRKAAGGRRSRRHRGRGLPGNAPDLSGLGSVLVPGVWPRAGQKDAGRLEATLLSAFGKQPRYVWLYKDGIEVQISMDRLQVGDVIVVNTGEVVPVDGVIKNGMAILDQHR